MQWRGGFLMLNFFHVMYFVFKENSMHRLKKIEARLIKLNTRFIIIVIIPIKDDIRDHFIFWITDFQFFAPWAIEKDTLKTSIFYCGKFILIYTDHRHAWKYYNAKFTSPCKRLSLRYDIRLKHLMDNKSNFKFLKQY